jgi:hypothetical protein
MNSFDNDRLNPTEQYDILHQVGLTLLGAAPEGWDRITFNTAELGGISESELLVRYEDGGTERRRFPHDVLDRLETLRSGMYQPGKGTWFSMTYTIVRPGRFSTEFNYDRPPEFTITPGASSYAADLAAFPREPEHIPDWLRRELSAAETEQD